MLLSYPTVHHSPAFGGTFPLADSLEAAAQAGWRHVGLDRFSVDAHIARGETLSGLARRLEGLGLSVTELTAISFTADRSLAEGQARVIADLAGATGASICVGVFAPGDTAVQPDGDDAIAIVESCAAILAAAGVRLALEFRVGSPLATPGQTLALCERVGVERASVLVDSWHTFVGDHLRSVADLRAPAIGLVQFCDAPMPLPGAHLSDASLNRRVLPGEGDFDLAGFVTTIAATGYDGVVSPEILSSTVRSTPPSAVASELLARSVELWESHLGTTAP